MQFGQFAEAESGFREYVRLTSQTKDVMYVIALQNIGVCRKKLGADEEAEQWYERALESSRVIGYLPSQADLLSNLAILSKNKARAALSAHDSTAAMQHFEAAARLYKEARKVDRDTGNLAGVALDLYNLGILYTHMKEPSRAKGAFDECIDIAKQLNDRGMLGKAQWGLGRLLVSTGKLKLAIDSFAEAARTLDGTLDIQSLAHVYSNLGAVLVELDDLRQARSHLERAKGLFLRTRQTTPESTACDQLLATVISKLGQ
jgi:tetratricopeptide (TPR) repeat protein